MTGTAVDFDASGFIWCNLALLKVSCFAWRLFKTRIPHASNLILRGLNVYSILCIICNLDEDNIDHVFFNCWFTREIWG